MAKRNRKFRKLIQVKDGGVMLLAKAQSLVDMGRGRIVDDRFVKIEDPYPGYERAPGIAVYSGRQSGYAGPTVMQAVLRYVR